MKLMDMPQKEVVGLFVWALQHVAQAQKPQQMVLSVPDAEIRCTTFGRVTAERLAPAGIKVDLQAWLYNHSTKKTRAEMRKEHPGIDRRPVFLITNDAIVLEPEVTDN